MTNDIADIRTGMNRIESRALEIDEDIAMLEQDLVYESDVSMASNIPKIGRWYMFLTTEPNGKSRYLISPMNRSSTFDFRIRQVITRMGIAEGHACSIVSKRVGEHEDIRTGKVVGIYQILCTPSFARAGIKVQELRDSLKKVEIEKLVKVHTYNIALRLKGLLQVSQSVNAALMKHLDDMEIDVVQVGGEVAEKIISIKRIGAEQVSKQLRRAKQPKIMAYIADNWQQLLIIGIIVFAAWWLLTPH